MSNPNTSVVQSFNEVVNENPRETSGTNQWELVGEGDNQRFIPPNTKTYDGSNFLSILKQFNLINDDYINELGTSEGVKYLPNLETEANEEYVKSWNNVPDFLSGQLKDALSKNELKEFFNFEDGSSYNYKNPELVEKFLDSYSAIRRLGNSNNIAKNNFTKYSTEVTKSLNKWVNDEKEIESDIEDLLNDPSYENITREEARKAALNERQKVANQYADLLDKSITDDLTVRTEKGVKNIKEKVGVDVEDKEDIPLSDKYTYFVHRGKISIIPRSYTGDPTDVHLGRLFTQITTKGSREGVSLSDYRPIGDADVPIRYPDGTGYRIRKWSIPIYNKKTGEISIPDLYYLDEIERFSEFEEKGTTGQYLSTLGIQMGGPIATNIVTAPLATSGTPWGVAAYAAINSSAGALSSWKAQTLRLDLGLQNEFNMPEFVFDTLSAPLAFAKTPKLLANKKGGELLWRTATGAGMGGIGNVLYQKGLQQEIDADIHGYDEISKGQIAASMALGGGLANGFHLVSKLFKSPDEAADFVSHQRLQAGIEDLRDKQQSKIQELTNKVSKGKANQLEQRQLNQLKREQEQLDAELDSFRSTNSSLIRKMVDDLDEGNIDSIQDFQRSYLSDPKTPEGYLANTHTDFTRLKNEINYWSQVSKTLDDVINGNVKLDSGKTDPIYRGLTGKKKDLIKKIKANSDRILKQRENEQKELFKEYEATLKKWEEEDVEINPTTKPDSDDVDDPLKTVVYHGTGAKFNEFSDEFKGSSTGAKSGEEAFWFVDNKKVADGYAAHAAEDGPINALKKQQEEAEKLAQKTNKPEDFDKVDEFTEQIENLDSSAVRAENRKKANVKEAILDGDFLRVDAGGKTPQELSEDNNIDSWLASTLEKARKQGKDGVIIENLDDALIADTPATHYAVFDKKNIKTVDPKAKAAPSDQPPSGMVRNDQPDPEFLRPFSKRTAEEKAEAIKKLISAFSKDPEDVTEQLNLSGLDETSEYYKIVDSLVAALESPELVKKLPVGLKKFMDISNKEARTIWGADITNGTTKGQRDFLNGMEKQSTETLLNSTVVDYLAFNAVEALGSQLRKVDLNDNSDLAMTIDMANMALNSTRVARQIRYNWGRQGRQYQENLEGNEDFGIENAMAMFQKKARIGDAKVLQRLKDGTIPTEEVSRYLKNRTQLENIRKDLKILKGIEDPRQFVKMLTEVEKRGGLGKLNSAANLVVEYYVNAILSHPSTQAITVISNYSNALYQAATRYGGAKATIGVTKIQDGWDRLYSHLLNNDINEAIRNRALTREQQSIEADIWGASFKGLLPVIGINMTKLQNVNKVALAVARGDQAGLSSNNILQELGANFDHVVSNPNSINKSLHNLRQTINTPTKMMSYFDELFKQLSARSVLDGEAQVKFNRLVKDTPNLTVGEILSKSDLEIRGIKDRGLEALKDSPISSLKPHNRRKVLAMYKDLTTSEILTEKGRFKSDYELRSESLQTVQERWKASSSDIAEDPEGFAWDWEREYTRLNESYSPMRERATQFAESSTFQSALRSWAQISKDDPDRSNLSLDKLVQFMEGGSQKLQAIKANHPSLSLAFPFVRTPFNIFKEIHKSVPLSQFPLLHRLLGQGEYYRIMKGDIPDATPAQVAELRGKAIAGAGLWASAWSLANNRDVDDEGNKFYITGAISKNKSALSNYSAHNGIQPYSIVFLDKNGKPYKSVKYNRFDPAGAMLGFCADIRDLYEDAETVSDPDLLTKLSETIVQAGGAGFEATANMITNRNYLQTVSALADVNKLVNYERQSKGSLTPAETMGAFIHYGTRDIVSGFNPSAHKFFSQSLDPMQRDYEVQYEGIIEETRKLVDSLKTGSNIYKTPRFNIFGEPLSNNTSSMAWFFPSTIKEVKDDKVHEEIVDIYAQRARDGMPQPKSKPARYGGHIDLRLKTYLGEPFPKKAREYVYNLHKMTPFEYYNRKIGQVFLDPEEVAELNSEFSSQFMGRNYKTIFSGKMSLREALTKLVSTPEFKRAVVEDEKTQSSDGKISMIESVLTAYKNKALDVTENEYTWIKAASKIDEIDKSIKSGPLADKYRKEWRKKYKDLLSDSIVTDAKKEIKTLLEKK